MTIENGMDLEGIGKEAMIMENLVQTEDTTMIDEMAGTLTEEVANKLGVGEHMTNINNETGAEVCLGSGSDETERELDLD